MARRNVKLEEEVLFLETVVEAACLWGQAEKAYTRAGREADTGDRVISPVNSGGVQRRH